MAEATDEQKKDLTKLASKDDIKLRATSSDQRKMYYDEMTKDFGKLVAAKCMKPQDFIYDGIIDEKDESIIDIISV